MKNSKIYLKNNINGKYTLPKRTDNPYTYGYEYGMGVSGMMDPAEVSYFQSIIGVMWWMVKLWRIDISNEVSLLSSHLECPRTWHIEAALHIMVYLKQKHNYCLVFDPTYPEIYYSVFKHCDWQQFYHEAEEAITPNAPKTKGKEVNLQMMVDSNHAGDKATRRSHPGFTIFLIILSFIGIPRIIRPLRAQCLERSLLPWRGVWELWGDCATGWGWWVSHWQAQRMLVVITCFYSQHKVTRISVEEEV